MTDNFLWIIPSLTIVFAIEGYFKKPIHHFFAKTSLSLKKRQQRIDESEMRYIFELAGDINFLILESIRVFAQGTIYFLTLIIFFLFFVQQGLFMDLIALLFGFMSIWIGEKATANLNIINQARKLYREDKQIDDELGPDFDETAYISQSPNNVECLRQAIEEDKAGRCVSIDLDK